MSRILLVDDSPHAQRMGERILTDEGYEVVTVSNAESALVRLDDVDPDVVLADTVMPGRTGFEICQYVKMSPKHRHVRVILTAGVLEPLDEAHTARVEPDGVLRKPFEASALLAAVKPLAEAAARDREGKAAAAPALAVPKVSLPFIAVVDSEQVRAAVTMALDAAMDAMVDEISQRVLAVLSRTKKAGGRSVVEIPPAPPPAPVSEAMVFPPPSASLRDAAPAGPPEPPIPAEPVRAELQPLAPQPRPAEPRPIDPRDPMTRVEPVRRISPLRLRTGSILGIEINHPDPAEAPPTGPRPPSSES